MSSRAFLKISLLADFRHFFENVSKILPFTVRPHIEHERCYLSLNRRKNERNYGSLRLNRKITKLGLRRLLHVILKKG